MEVTDFITDEIIKEIQGDILGSNNQEIFLIGILDPESKKVFDYNLLARGNERMVPAIINDLKPGTVLIHNHPSGDLRPSAADIRIASRAGNIGVGFAIINNQVNDIYIVVEPQIPQEEIKLSFEEITDIFKEKGQLSANLPGYEYRKQQVEVVKRVIESFNKHQFNLIEAGTGTGKSFAYLIPALYWSHLNNQPVIVSTNTINLQEQLIEKDLVFLRKILPFNFKAVLVKGRGNYVCRRKVKNLEKRSPDIFIDDEQKGLEFSQILNWLEDTDTGSRSDLHFMLSTDLWEEIACESDLCLRTKCPYFDSCFFIKARKEVYSADLLIVNHHLLMADAILKYEAEGQENGVLPAYSHLIIDEAHNFSDTATNHLGNPFNLKMVNKLIQRLYQKNYSLIPRLRQAISKISLKNKENVYNLLDQKIIPIIQRIKDYSKDYFIQLAEFVASEEEDELRLTKSIINSGLWQEIKDNGDKLAGYFNNLGVHLNHLYEEFNKLTDEDLHKIEEEIMELESATFRLGILLNNLDFNLLAEDKDYVFWLKKLGKEKVYQENAPLEISQILQELIWSRLDTLILSSATLTVNNSFKFIKDELGLPGSNELQVSSPFDYQKQARLLIPDDIPAANSLNFLQEIIDGLKKLLINFNGNTMVLFTSYSMLNYCFHKTEEEVKEAGLNILAQGRLPRRYIIQEFKEKRRQIIFGTVSFWEGVDIKGDNLKYLIIMKLPFPVPSEPVAAARMERMQEKGINPFFNYSIPRAVIRFKQGFGRLIRSKKDRGLIISFDNRLLTKNYGKIFLNSLPRGCPVEKLSMKSLVQRGESYVEQ